MLRELVIQRMTRGSFPAAPHRRYGRIYIRKCPPTRFQHREYVVNGTDDDAIVDRIVTWLIDWLGEERAIETLRWHQQPSTVRAPHLQRAQGRTLRISTTDVSWRVLPSGRWQAELYLGKDPATGRQRRVYGSGETRTDALEGVRRRAHKHGVRVKLSGGG